MSRTLRLALTMPVVQGGMDGIAEHLQVIRDKKITAFSAYVPDEDDQSVVAIFYEIKTIGVVKNAGLRLSADMYVEDMNNAEWWAQEYGKAPSDLATVPEKTIKACGVHLCGKKPCRSVSPVIHIGEWCYLGVPGSGEEAGDEKLMKALAAFTANPPISATSPPKRKVQSTTIYTPARSEDPLLKWCCENSVEAMHEILLSSDLRSVRELGALMDADITSLFAAHDDNPMLTSGVKARFRMGHTYLKENAEPTSDVKGSGWVDQDTGIEVPMHMLRGVERGGPEYVLWPETGHGLMQNADGSWVKMLRKAGGTNVGFGNPGQMDGGNVGRGVPDQTCGTNIALGNPGQMDGGNVGRGFPGALNEATIGPVVDTASVFGQAGPLEMLAENAKAMLSRTAAGTAGQPQKTVCTTFDVPDVKGPWDINDVRPNPKAAEFQETTAGGRLIVSAGPRKPGQMVALKVKSSQAAALYEEWSSAGRLRLQDQVANRSWRDVSNKRAAFGLARAVDVGLDTGLDVTREPIAEVLLRELAALWFADRHPKDHDVAEWMKESSMAHFGIPRSVWEEARAMKKMATAVTSTDEGGC